MRPSSWWTSRKSPSALVDDYIIKLLQQSVTYPARNEVTLCIDDVPFYEQGLRIAQVRFPEAGKASRYSPTRRRRQRTRRGREEPQAIGGGGERGKESRDSPSTKVGQPRPPVGAQVTLTLTYQSALPRSLEIIPAATQLPSQGIDLAEPRY